jgi:hypothetical protein
VVQALRVQALRKCVALLSVLLLLTAFRCMAACIAGDSGSSAPASSSHLPPCHKHPGPAQGKQNSIPCQTHPGLLAWSVHQPCAPIDLHPSLVAIHEPVTLMREAGKLAQNRFAPGPLLPLPEAVSPIVLRI